MRTSHELLSNPDHGLVREAREPQLRMAASIEEALRDGGAYFVEAPVATGKTYAYLLPLLLAAGRRAVVSTGKKQLQDQIVDKDFPTLKKVLGNDVPPMAGIPLKGKGNYACRLIATSIMEKNDIGDPAYVNFLQRSTYGDRATYPGAPPRWWGAATAEDCVGKSCDHFNDCGYVRVKRDASQAKLTVINHHLLGSEMYFGFGKMVGGPFDVLIIDEAHTLAAGIRAAFTYRIAEDSITALETLVGRTGTIIPAMKKLRDAWHLMFETVDRHDEKERTPRVFNPASATHALNLLREIGVELTRLQRNYQGEHGDEDGDVNVPLTVPVYDDGLSEFDEPDPDAEPQTEMDRAVNDENKGRALAVINQAQRRLDGLLRGLSTAQGIVDPDPTETDPARQEMRRLRILANQTIYATEDDRGRFGINCAPINVGGIAGKYLAAVKTVIVCSATLAVDGVFDHISNVTGVSPSKAEILPTSFNYDAQGFVFVPRKLPVISDKKDPEYHAVMRQRVDLAVHLTELSDGGAFILTTANDELDMFADAMKRRFPGRVFAQGHRKNQWDGDPPAALAKFRATPDSILIGSRSFWEGVDVPGGALRLVIIAKLPFPPASDPIVNARNRVEGGNYHAWTRVQLVDMLVDLRQGVGRLIRSKDDRGCVAILDSRIWDKSYGGAVRRALPWSNTCITSDVSVCEKYLPRFAAHFRKFAQ